MKKTTALLLLSIFCLSMFTGCTNTAAIDTDDTADEEYIFKAVIMEIYDGSVIVEPMENEDIRASSDKLTFGISELGYINPQIGDIVSVAYTGIVRESHPAQIDALSWSVIKKAPLMCIGAPIAEPTITEYVSDNIRMSVAFPDGWAYITGQLNEGLAGGGPEGIAFWTESDPEFTVNIEYHTQMIGICGTGVTFTDMTFANGYTATACTEKIGDDYWFMLIYDEPNTNCAVSCSVPYELWTEYEESLMSILDTVQFELFAAE